MRRVALAELPLERRAEVARDLILGGEDPYMMLAAAVWPNHVGFYVDPPTVINKEDYCKNGHPWNEENTAIRKGTNWRRCRACDREGSKRWPSKKTPYRRVYRKEPCAYCGEPATSAQDKGTGGLETPRCRACFWKHYGERRRAS